VAKPDGLPSQKFCGEIAFSRLQARQLDEVVGYQVL
jgi:hypothetical protein